MKEEYNIVTEVGVFGDLNINDPTVQSVKKKNNEDSTDEEIQQMISESIQTNASALIK